jgi:putative Mg2+ transporter-C (MgtC) family protein
MLTFDTFAAYWSGPMIVANFLVLLHLLGALLLGLLVGYERSYHGRAAGMRTYGLVCMATAAVTVIGGYAHFWYGGNAAAVFSTADLSRVVQGILTGIGFLCAGVIMKEGFNISGLTTAASIWAASVIGVLVGVGLFGAAMSLALLSAGCMILVSKLEAKLPSRQAVSVNLSFSGASQVGEGDLRSVALAHGYVIAGGTIMISLENGNHKWNFIAVALSRTATGPLSDFAAALDQLPGLNGFHLAYARN